MADLGVGAASLGIAVVALAAALMQVTMQVDIEARRRGKTDRLALGEWSIEWPQTKLYLHYVLRLFWLKSPWGDPRALTVPFITVGEIVNYLYAEAQASGRGDLRRRMGDRLVASATNTVNTGRRLWTGRTYAVRETTRKRCEACWSDAMDMCGFTRKHWSLLSSVTAQPCSGVIRPANAVTNLHSLWGFGRVMGLRDVVRSGSKITLTNGGASLYLDLYAGADRPVRLAHFSGSALGRYRIIKEMSQHTAASVYADGSWAAGHVPLSERLSPRHKPSPGAQSSTTRLSLPEVFPLCRGSICASTWSPDFDDWASRLTRILREVSPARPNYMNLLDYVSSPAVVACIRTFPVSQLPPNPHAACNGALIWCVRYWPLCRYQRLCIQMSGGSVHRPFLPALGSGLIGPEFVTGAQQAQEWYSEALSLAEKEGGSVLVDAQGWELVKQRAEGKIMEHSRSKDESAEDPGQNSWVYTLVVKVLQLWKLELYVELQKANSATWQASPEKEEFDALLAMLATVTMASIAVATDSTLIGEEEVNRAMEIELGGGAW
ncbi:hypothetical protein OE88DRAFT_1739920 [Heliocybe sulcata]|uniref:Uncharacterized protein n=1 Tax=Heliocybe sulcata TaxID=5364 RepID=A0A5C3MM39_9AGAM|nr:hypothetical protein OE88DRAFT_1739920 [Heliocybe sulcata]